MVDPFLLKTFACVPPAGRWGLERLWLSHCVALAMLCVAGCEDRCQAQSKEASSKPAETAKALYQQLCRRCHAMDGKGDPATEGVPDFTRKAWQQQKSDTELMVTILEGKGISMPTFRDRISRAQAKVLASYVRAFAPTELGIQQVTSPDSREFQVQFQQLQKDFEGLQRQLKELTGENAPGKLPQEAAQEEKDPEGTKDSLRAAGVLFRRHCQRCHGKDGKGGAGRLNSLAPPDFTLRVWQDERSNARLLKRILDGKNKDMPAFAKELDENQARDLVDYIRAFTPPRRANSSKPDKDPGRTP
jgi:cytochrome c oxidase cbb3-type subunit 3